jgi:hypothetical protein
MTLTEREYAALEVLDKIAIRLRRVHLLMARELDTAIKEAEIAMRDARLVKDGR